MSWSLVQGVLIRKAIIKVLALVNNTTPQGMEIVHDVPALSNTEPTFG